MARTMIGYKSYMFRSKDPAIDRLGSVVSSEFGKCDRKAWNEIHRNTGVSVTTMQGWWYGKTRRPQNASLEAVGRGMGYQREWVKIRRKAMSNGRRKP